MRGCAAPLMDGGKGKRRRISEGGVASRENTRTRCQQHKRPRQRHAAPPPLTPRHVARSAAVVTVRLSQRMPSACAAAKSSVRRHEVACRSSPVEGSPCRRVVNVLHHTDVCQ